MCLSGRWTAGLWTVALAADLRPFVRGSWTQIRQVHQGRSLGLFCIPFVLWLAPTGSIHLFKPHFERWLDRTFHQLSVGAARSRPEQQVVAALAAIPG